MKGEGGKKVTPRVLNRLEFNKMKERLMKQAACSLGQQKIEELSPSTDLKTVERLQEETDEGATVLRLKGHIPFGGISDIRQHLKRSEIGGMLSSKELSDIADTIRGSRVIKRFIQELVEEEVNIPILLSIVDEINPQVELEKKIRLCIGDNGEVLDTASETLRTVRTQIRTYDSRVKEKLESIVRSPNTQKMLTEAIITIRNGRQVVPVKPDYRHKFGGIVHDQSASGATFFIEPQSVVEINNKLSEARARERYEIERILRLLSEETSFVASELYHNVDQLAKLDLIYAKAKLGHQMKATRPHLNDKGVINMKRARHPLIDPDQVVPIDIRLGDHHHAMIITGPNTGGKTVTLKTIGLLTLMTQAGLQIPVDEDSTVNVFKKVFADIGDEQSIEQSLSTFSSHMTNIVRILNEVDFQSLVLFDELGAGTDPQEGAALSIAILDTVFERGATVVCTTHYSELKAYAFDRSGVLNASVEFDVETLRPTYRLLLGVPGRSNAFEISRKLGLDERIIEEARKQISTETNQVDRMIASLEKNRKEAEKAEIEARTIKEEVKKRQIELTKEMNQIEEKRNRLIKEARSKAEEAVNEAKKEAEEIIKELRSLKAQSGKVKEHQLIDAKTRLDHALDSLSQNETKRPSPTYKKETKTFSPGQEIKVISFGQKGHVLEKINDHEYRVQIGILKMNVSAQDIKPIKVDKEVKPVVNVRTSGHVTKTECDLRGDRYEDAMQKVEKYLDDALLAGYHQVSIIHGKGTGALRNGVQSLLKSHPRVKSSRLGGAGEGGSGVTVVELK